MKILAQCNHHPAINTFMGLFCVPAKISSGQAACSLLIIFAVILIIFLPDRNSYPVLTSRKNQLLLRALRKQACMFLLGVLLLACCAIAFDSCIRLDPGLWRPSWNVDSWRFHASVGGTYGRCLKIFPRGIRLQNGFKGRNMTRKPKKLVSIEPLVEKRRGGRNEDLLGFSRSQNPKTRNAELFQLVRCLGGLIWALVSQNLLR